MTGIYKITSPSNKIYIGSSINIFNRIKYYKSFNCKGQIKLYNSLKKHGWNNHKFEILEECNLDELYKKERYYGDLFNVLSDEGLNLILPNNGEIKKGVSDETRKKMSESKKGIKNTFYNKKHSNESKLKISLSKIGKIPHNKGKKGILNYNMSKIVLDTQSGIYYKSCKECSIYNEINYNTLRSYLNGSNKNKSRFIYC